jgi:pyruvate/2-oxoglutarate dehydrogenase complex dihydrolipoamide dehydrogenase (E3) component
MASHSDHHRHDAIVIGSGSGGVTVAVGLATLGRSVLLVERHQMGGDCTNTGCIPSKSLLHHAGRRPAPVNHGSDVLALVRVRRDGLRHHEEEHIGGMDGIDLRYGRAELLAPGRIRVTPDNGPSWEAEADHVVVATGSSPVRLDIPGLPDDRMLTNLELFELEQVPDRLAIIGGGAVGAEMAVAFRRLGSTVSIVEAAERVLPGLLPVVSATVKRSLSESGIDVITGAMATGYDVATDRLSHSAGSVDADQVLVAVGRRPNTEGLGLSRLGVELNGTGRIVTDRRGRTNLRGLWAVGDVADTGGSTHMAGAWGRRVFQSIVYPRVPIGDEPPVVRGVFTEPEVADIGDQPEIPPPDVERIAVDGTAVDRAYTDEVDHVLLVVDVRRFTGTVLGATVIGPRAGEVLLPFSLAMRAGVPFHRFYGMVAPYPSHGDIIAPAVDQYLSATLPELPRRFGSWANGRLRAAIGAITER